MDDLLNISNTESEAGNGNGEKKKKKEQKEDKKDLTLDKLELSLYRTQLAMLRTATTTTSLGFALYKLLEEKKMAGKEGPLMRVFTPRILAMVLLSTGFIGLVSYSVRHVTSLKKINRLTPKFYYSGVMIVSYVILLITLFLFIGAALKG